MAINSYIDHTLLKPTATKQDIFQLCEEAKKHHFYAVCINSCYVSIAKNELKTSSVKVCSVIGFPLGAMSTQSKVEEEKQAVKDGADEIDMVLNLGWLKSADFDAVWKDIEAVKIAIGDKILKVILEICYLSKAEIIKASELALLSGADFIKTSTGFGTGGATVEAVTLMKSVVGVHAKVKASGGIRDRKTALEYINLGVNRIGTSSGIEIVSSEQN
ncbi:MAG: deoxyribose-phosphate aldolase [Bacteroidetes bacterium HGW-Bacteroidetes-2]|nr:MAG: deoxyribose-phosphate aldolase [Bacteroidetes bacterium HGW-Bacteroidetes-2]